MRSTSSVGTPVDLSTCAQEPIRIPGTIQPHGVLLALDRSSLEVFQVSENAAEIFPSGALGKCATDLFQGDWVGTLKSSVSRPSADPNPIYLGPLTIDLASRQQCFQAMLHCVGSTLVLELESVALETGVTFIDLYAHLRSFLAEIQNTPQASDLVGLAAREVRRMTGFDRVLIYRFEENWNGHVVAEARDDLVDSYLDFWFPASDIPAQARELYRSNRLRLIVDVAYQPVAITPPLHPKTGQPLDLSFSTMRSVSPIHIEYLKNMGVGASMSISLLWNGRLWGLIACHHRAPLRVSFEVRTACDFLAQAFSLQLSAAEQAAEYEQRLRLKGVQSQLLTFMAQEDYFVDGLAKHPEELLQLAGAQGAAILFDQKCVLIGSTPPESQVRELADWIAENQQKEIYSSDSFPSEIGDHRLLSLSSGVLAIPISRLYRSFVIWFRPEVIQTLTWSGDPAKSVEQQTDGGLRIHPRKSFQAWRETVHGRSLPWKKGELETAADLRISILEIVLRKAEELAHLNGELERSNKELEAFSYSVSHDLRAPFRHIVGYSSLLRERIAASEDQDVVRYVDTIIDSAQSAGSLVDNLLHFAQIGRSSLNTQLIPQTELVNEVKNAAEREVPAGRQITWKIEPLPIVHGDLLLLRLVWQNLISNAIKYSRPRVDAVIEIGSQRKEEEIVFFVRDNGVGFDSRYRDKLFGVFQRLHRVEEFEGNGIGLANVRRIVARHGGRTWAEGELGQGAVFYFSIPRNQVFDAD